MLLAMDGCVGLSMLADRNSGRCIATSAWRTREAMLASERQLRRLRDHAAEILGNRPQVDEWEIAVLHRDHTSGPGACVRASWVRMAPAQADRVVEVYRTARSAQMRLAGVGAAQHGDFVSQCEDLDVLGRV